MRTTRFGLLATPCSLRLQKLANLICLQRSSRRNFRRTSKRLETRSTTYCYAPATAESKRHATQRTLDLPLPRAHRKIGPLDLRSAIHTLAGEPWHLHEDAIQRVIWLTLKDEVDLESGVPEDIAVSVQETPPPPPAPSAPLPQVLAEWTLDTSLTLRGNFDVWTRIADWSLEWNSRHDYAVDQVAAYNGTLKDRSLSRTGTLPHGPDSTDRNFLRGQCRVGC